MAGDDGPEAAEIGHVWGPFVHQGGGAVGEGAVDDVAVSGDPANVGGAPVDVFIVNVEDVFAGDVGADHVAAGGVNDALGLAGGTAGVEYIERVFGVHRFGGT